jgi:hypothetical protein
MPTLDRRSQPQARSAGPKIKNRPRHIRIPALVLADGVAVAESEDPGNVVSVDEVVDQNASGHMESLRPLADVSYACNLSVRPRM